MPQLATYVGLARDGEKALADSFRAVAAGHPEEGDLGQVCLLMARLSHRHRHRLAPMAGRYATTEGDDLHSPPPGVDCHGGPGGLLRDLLDLYVLATLVQTTWTVIAQGAGTHRDAELAAAAVDAMADTRRQLAWLGVRLKQAAPHCLEPTEGPG